MSLILEDSVKNQQNYLHRLFPDRFSDSESLPRHFLLLLFHFLLFAFVRPNAELRWRIGKSSDFLEKKLVFVLIHIEFLQKKTTLFLMLSLSGFGLLIANLSILVSSVYLWMFFR